jgi:hypothetical protein
MTNDVTNGAQNLTNSNSQKNRLPGNPGKIANLCYAANAITLLFDDLRQQRGQTISSSLGHPYRATG